MRSVHNAPTQFSMDREAIRTMFRFLRGSFWMYVLGLLPLQVVLVQLAQAHEFVVAISANGTESDLILTDAVRGFLLVWKQLPYYRRIVPIVEHVPLLLPIMEAVYSLFAKYRLPLTGKKL